MRTRPWVATLALMGIVPAVLAQDWLAGEYEVIVPGDPAPSRFVMVITQVADGQYRDDVFVESVDAPTGRIFRRPVPQPAGANAGVRVLTAGEIAEPGLIAANVRCAEVDGMVLCQIPEGASIDFDGRTLQAGYFGAGMHVGLIDVRKRALGSSAQAASLDRHETR